jgi:hypothetical protein
MKAETDAPPKNWWGAVWRGLVVDEAATHYRRMDGALWLFLYLIIHADRVSGALRRKYVTIAHDMRVSERSIRGWMATLRRHGYVKTTSTGRGQVIHIEKWKPYTPKRPPDAVRSV